MSRRRVLIDESLAPMSSEARRCSLADWKTVRWSPEIIKIVNEACRGRAGLSGTACRLRRPGVPENGRPERSVKSRSVCLPVRGALARELGVGSAC
jgi:hypothetical protein